MNNKDMPAMPLATEELSDRYYEGAALETGLTKLEYAAIHIMSACVSNDGFPYSNKDLSEKVTYLAESLFEELEKNND